VRPIRHHLPTQRPYGTSKPNRDICYRHNVPTGRQNNNRDICYRHNVSTGRQNNNRDICYRHNVRTGHQNNNRDVATDTTSLRDVKTTAMLLGIAIIGI
jgi:hypothetical protein